MDKRNKLILAGAVFVGGLFLASRKANAAWAVSPVLEIEGYKQLGPIDSIVEKVWEIFGTMSMKDVNRALVNHPQVKAFLAVIRRGEGTADSGGYNRMFGGGSFSSFADHPRKSNCLTFANGKPICSTAAGAYQALASTWDETAKAIGLMDFSPASQDLFALGRLAYRKALDDVLAGNFEAAIQKAAKEWASLPGSPYGQPTISFSVAYDTFKRAGGMVA